EWNQVLSPKVDGVQILDQATIAEPLDVFITFSSVTGVLGNSGQSDYATANAFMDAYAVHRNVLVAKGERSGQTLSLNWPLWKEGGMQVDAAAEAQLFETMGMVPLPTEAGVTALYQALATTASQVMIIEGDRQLVTDKVINSASSPKKALVHQENQSNIADNDQVKEEAIQYFKKMLSSVMKLPVAKIKADVAMEDYGIDSVMVMKLTSQLEKAFGTLSKTLFFEYQTIRELSDYFLTDHYQQLTDILGVNQVVEEVALPDEKLQVSDRNPLFRLSQLAAKSSRKAKSDRATSLGTVKNAGSSTEDIAIVGLSGKYPQADNLEEFWQNLSQGKDSVTEVPLERWDHSRYFDADKTKAGKTYSKWGGFINGADEFDPLFFNISPKEAELLDPQERIFLQCAYETIEDAGYSRKSLSNGNTEGNVGVYVGVMYEEYQLFGAQETQKGNNIALFGNPSSVANRVSYFYNFNGPSMAVDTMCSSSLTAIHLACQSIQNGDCKAAIAGGVNLSIHPNKYLLLAQGRFVSSKGRCESFGIGGDGYVPGEGVGAVMLKPLSQAIADGNHVYGVIKGTSLNHGGKTNGYTVPNPKAQAKVIDQAYQRAQIDPRTVSYVEAHGTGTSLGDPIEITGLNKAFGHYTKDLEFCAIGSVKSNIGHCESAAGMAGLTKILLQLKHQQLVPSLHSETLNPNIDFSKSPFRVQQELTPWTRPVVGQNGSAKEYLRRAGLSSFGAGGANAHLIVEELEQKTPSRSNEKLPEPVLVLLSAKNEDRLKVLAQRLIHALDHGHFVNGDLVDIAYTLQVGRDALDARVAMVVTSID
ncbi:MAG: beta-ketoacyl synthase N-terminal-like domain-containing protein, partial [Bacteroidota bacterium]